MHWSNHFKTDVALRGHPTDTQVCAGYVNSELENNYPLAKLIASDEMCVCVCPVAVSTVSYCHSKQIFESGPLNVHVLSTCAK